MIHRFLQRLAALHQSLGIRGTISYLLARGLSTSGVGRYYDYILLAQPVPSAPQSTSRRSTIQVRPIAAADYRLEWFERPARVIEQRYRQGGVCLVAFQGDEVIGCLWLIRASYLEDEVHCRYQLHPAAHCSWDFDVYLHPHHRLGRGFSALWEAANQWLREHQQHWSFSRIHAANRASLRAHQRLGAVVVGSAVFFCSGPLQFMLSTCRPHVHLAWRPQQHATLYLSAPRGKINSANPRSP